LDFGDKNCSLPDDEAGEVPTAYVVRAAGSNLSKSEVIAFIHKQVRFLWGLFIDVANARKLLFLIRTGSVVVLVSINMSSR
jgi:hypothetical protein